MKRKVFSFCVLCFCLLILTGCSGRVKFSGRVTYEDGTPLTIGDVYFTNETYMAHGSIDKDGYYYLTSYNPGDGIVPGDYQVYITNTLLFGEPEEEEQEDTGTGKLPNLMPPVATVDPVFADPDANGLKCTIKGSGTYDITVYRPGEVPEQH